MKPAKAILIRLTPEQHRDYRIAAAKTGTTMTAVIRETLDKWAEEVMKNDK